MSTFSVDWTVAIFLLMALVMVRSLRHQIRADSAESYGNIAGGLTILALATLAKVYHGLEIFSSVPFLSESVFFDLVYWISVITGGTFLISGVAHWTPLARYHRVYNKTRIQHLDLVRRVEQLVAVENRPDSILMATLEHIIEQMSFERGVVLKGSVRHGQMQVVSQCGAAGVDTSLLSQVRLRSEYIALIRDGQQPEPQTALENQADLLAPPDKIFPIKIDGQVVGLFILWESVEREYSSDDDLILRLTADIVARKINGARTALKLAAVESRATWAASVVERAIACTSNREKFSAAFHGLTERLPVESASLCIWDLAKPVMTKYSIGKGSQILVENNMALPAARSPLAACFERGEDLFGDQPDSASIIDFDNVVSGTTVRSFAAVTFTLQNAFRAVLVVGSAAPGAIGQRYLGDLKSLRPLLVDLLISEQDRDRQINQMARISALETLAAAVAQTGLSSHTFEKAAQIISDELGSDIVRISTLDDTGRFLGSRVVISSQPVSSMVPANGQSILSLMPLHRQAIAEARPVKIVSGSGNQMSEIEISQVFAPGVNSASIYPILARGKPVAVISAANMALAGDLNNPATEIFIGTASHILATGFDKAMTTRSEAGRATMTPDRRAQLRSSLTGILGSVELLRNRPVAVDDQASDKYLSIIDRSARRISEAMTEEEPVI